MTPELFDIFEIAGYENSLITAKVIKVEGYYSKGLEEHFFIPNDGYYLLEGGDGFLKEEDAQNRLRELIKEEILLLTERWKELG